MKNLFAKRENPQQKMQEIIKTLHQNESIKGTHDIHYCLIRDICKKELHKIGGELKKDELEEVKGL